VFVLKLAGNADVLLDRSTELAVFDLLLDCGL